jgi:signal transduction histidine kinase
LLALAALFYISLWNGQERVRELSEGAFETLRLASNVKDLTATAHRELLRTLSVAANEADRRRIDPKLEALAQAKKQAAASFDELGRHLGDDAPAMAQLRAELEVYTRAADIVIDIVKSDPAAASIFAVPAEESFDRLATRLEGFKAEADRVRAATATRTIDAATRSSSFFLAILALAVVLSVLVTKIAAGAIARPIEKELEKRLADAEAANRAQSAFLAMMSHELRTPLSAIIGFSEMMERKLMGPLSGTYCEYSAIIANSGRHLLAIINDILDVAKLQSGKMELHPEPIEIKEVMDAAYQSLRVMASERSVNLLRHLPQGSVTVMADPIRLRQILINLVSNGVKFTLAGGSVTMTAEIRGTIAVVEVSDTGIGMSAEDIPKALMPFGQIANAMTRNHEGTGLGLPLSKNLVELHGGNLEIESTPGRGTTIRFTLPQAIQDVGLPTPAMAAE